MRRILALLLAAATAAAEPWDGDTLELFARLPVQEGGRVKPLSTVAKFALLRLNYRSSFRDAEGNQRTALEWMLGVLLRPDEARQERIFLVEDSAALDAIGLEHDGRKRRDRYSYDEIAPARDRLVQLLHEYERIDKSDRNSVQSQVIDLAHNVNEFEAYARFLDFGRAGDLERLNREKKGDDATFHRLQGAVALALFPPVGDAKEWLSPASLVFAEGPPAAEHVTMLHLLETLAGTADEAEFRSAAAEFCSRSRQLATARGEYRKVPLEVSYYRLDAFYRSLVLYILGFLAVAASWLWPNKWILRAGFALGAAGLLLNVTGIVLRCVLIARPPITNLYDTVIFITAVGALSALVIEIINRRRIGLAAAPILGALGLFIASRYEVIDRQDTLRPLVAVLDTNFWLATHVTTINIGYAAGLLAGAIAHVYVLGRVLGLKRGDASFYRNVARMVYGVTCFSLVFSVCGTILGGVWANDSWGRFWGWDPKENGALMIVLSQLALLHGRMGGHLRDLGISMAAIFGGMVVAWSWWGVNLLSVGLHSYGFVGGVWTGLLSFWIVEALVLVAGVVSWLNARSLAPPESTDSGTPAV